MLANVTKKERRVIGEKPMEKRKFTFFRCKEYNYKVQAVQLIRKFRPGRQGKNELKKQLPYEVKAKNQYQFKRRDQKNKKRQS